MTPIDLTKHMASIAANYTENKDRRAFYEAMIKSKENHGALVLELTFLHAKLDQIQAAIRDYHFALDSREHGGVAQGRAFDQIVQALNMPWAQGAEKQRRETVASTETKVKGVCDCWADKSSESKDETIDSREEDSENKAMSDAELQRKKKDGYWIELGNYFWRMLTLLPKEDPERQKASKQFNSLTKREQRLCDGAG